MNRTTRWPEAIPMSATSSSDCAAALLGGWIQRFGVPTTITSDRGPQFTAALWASTCRLLAISHVPTTAYHPQANGLVERFHRRLKDALRARSSGPDWYSHLPWVMLGIRSTWREDAQFSPAEAVFGSQPVLPGQFLDAPEPPSPSFLSEFQGVLAKRTPPAATCKSLPGPVSLPEDLLLARHVLVRRDGPSTRLYPLYDGLYPVLECSLRFSNYRLVRGQTPSPRCASKRAGRHRTSPLPFRQDGAGHLTPANLPSCRQSASVSAGRARKFRSPARPPPSFFCRSGYRRCPPVHQDALSTRRRGRHATPVKQDTNLSNVGIEMTM
jgi:hypothetical protein